MNRKKLLQQMLGLTLVTLLLIACESPAPAGARGLWTLTADEHKEVMTLLKQIYEQALGEYITTWFETEAKGYRDLDTDKVVNFPHPIRTISVAIPDYVRFREDIPNKIGQVIRQTSYKGWYIKTFEIEVDPHGAGGGAGGYFDKLTVYPIEVQKR